MVFQNINFGLQTRVALIVLLICFFQLYAGSLQISWNENTEQDLAGYRIYYGLSSQAYTDTIDVGNVTHYTVGGLVDGETYYVAVTAYDFSGNESEFSDQVFATVGTHNIAAAYTTEGVAITWDEVNGADSYQVFQSAEPYFTPGQPVATITQLSYTDNSYSEVAGQGRYYLIKALSGGEEIFRSKRVGVFTSRIAGGTNMVSIPLIPDNPSISAVLGAQLHGATNFLDADKVYYWKGSGYNIAWLVEGTTGPLEGKWMNLTGSEESTIELSPDHSFWIIHEPEEEELITFAGIVSEEASRTITLTEGTNFIGWPFPLVESLDQSELYEDGVVKGATNSIDADKIMRWNPDFNQFEMAWCVDNTGTEFDGKWYNQNGSGLTTIQFKPGFGYVLLRQNQYQNNDWSVPNPNF